MSEGKIQETPQKPEEQEIDLIELAQKVWAERKMLYKVCGIAAVIGLIVGFSIPKEYSTEVTLAPESASKMNAGSMGALAAMAGQLKLRPYQTLHFELGRAVVGQCGSLISKVLYVKQGAKKKFAILDAGFTELIRPAMYDAYHRIENISSDEAVETYDVVGPICESSDVFGKDVELNKAHRGDLIALRSAGAYGEVMASQYNCRHLPKAYYSDTIK